MRSEHTQRVRYADGSEGLQAMMPAYPGNGPREVFGMTEATAKRHAGALLNCTRVEYLGLRRDTEGELWSAWRCKA